MNIGGLTNLIYDNCSYKKRSHERTAPLSYQLYGGKFENCNKCRQDKFYRPFDLVQQESELKNITRPGTHCPEKMYNPKCKKSGMCTSTFDKSNPVVLAPEVCPIVHSNLTKTTDIGYKMPKTNFCGCK